VTLTGGGGVGKTRLAVEVAARSADEFPDGVWVFELAAVNDPAAVPDAVAAVLALNAHARDRMLDEVDTVLARRRPTAEDLAKLPWTTACIQEAQRYFSAAWTLGREAIADDDIDGHRIRAGTTVMIPIHHIHHDPRWWPNPEQFDPTWFMPAADGERPRSAYLPFGGGRRSCIGQTFALMEMVLMASIMSQQFNFELRPGYPVELEATLTLQPKHGLHVIGPRRTS
jgi:cytochrome P450